MSYRSWLPVWRLICVLLAGVMAAAPAWSRVGVASVTDGAPVGKPPDAPERVLHVGNDMNADELVTTKANDRAHIVFLDGSTLTVGPNSAVKIDKFVYNPDQKTGEMSLNATRGVFRYVGGAISKKSEVVIKTPSATMGIRGGIATFAVSATGATTANFLFGGSLSITSAGVTRTTSSPGSQITVAPGLPPTPPAAIPPGSLQTNQVQAFQAPPAQNQAGQAGGGPAGQAGTAAARGAAITAAFSNSGLRQSNSSIPPAAAKAAIPATQQVQLAVAKPAAAPQQVAAAAAQPAAAGQQSGGPQQGSAAGQGAGPAQGAGLQGSGSLQGAGSQQVAGAQPGGGPVPASAQAAAGLQGSGPLQGAGPLQSAGPLQGAGPLQSAGPLQNAGPLQSAGPLQAAGPLTTAPQSTAFLPGTAPPPMAFNAPPAQPLAPLVPAALATATPTLASLVAGLVTGDSGAANQLQQLLSTPQGTTVPSLTTLVNALTSLPPPTSSPPVNPPTFTPLSPSAPSPPQVFNNPQGRMSPN